MKRVLIGAIVIVLAVMVVKAIPDIRRYKKMISM